MRQDAVFSQASVSIAGQRPAAFSATVRMDMGIRMPVRGRARRLVSRKYVGNVLKYSQARGAVVSWQLIVKAALSHVFFIIGQDSPSGHRLFR